MPGRLVHTNEVLVLLGDNWFAERTALQARDIAGRRLQDCREQLKSAEQAAKLQSHWVEQGETLQSEEGIDIVEEVSEEEYAKQQERHREMVRAHRHQLRQERLQQHSVSSKASSRKRSGAPPVTGHSEQEHKTYDDLMKRLDTLTDMEREEGSEEEEGSGNAMDSEELEDDLSEETDEEETSDSDSDDDKETQPNRTAAENDDEEKEDSDEDLPAEFNKFKHVKIESPMPSSERKFQYSDPDDDGVEDELGDMDEVEEVIRGRTCSFTRSVDGDHPRSDSKGRDSSSDSRTGGGGGGGGGPRGPGARRVSWADQSPYIVSEDSGGGGVIKIRYMATQKAAGEEEPGKKEETTVETPSSAEGTPLVTVILIPAVEACQAEQMEADSKTSSVKTPADLARLAGHAAADSKDKETHSSVSITVPLDPPPPAEAPSLPAITAITPRKPKKSILKRTPSQDGAVVDTVAGMSWLQSSESVPITNVYHHEPIVDPSSEEASQHQDKRVPPAVKSRVVARDVAESTGPLVKGEAEEQELPTKKMSKFKAGRLKQ